MKLTWKLHLNRTPNIITDEYFELDLPTAPAVMVEDEIIVEGSDLEQYALETAICRHLGIDPPNPEEKGFLKKLFKK